MTAPEQERDGLQILHERRPVASEANDLVVVGAAVGAGLAAAGFAVGVLLDWSINLYGTLLAVALLLLGVAVRRYFVDRYPDVTAVEPRATPEQPPADEPIAAVAEVGRRPFLTRTLLGAGGLVGVSLLSLVPSLGPRVGDQLQRTPWRNGLALVRGDGGRIRPEDLAVGGIVTAWPEGNIGFERAAVVVLRLSDDPVEPTNLDWVVDGNVVAYSKICTHAGCPVALFRERDDRLFCPCHQSTFDVRAGAAPVFGPAARGLPQLPLGVDADGDLIALGDFTEQAGPAFG